MESHHRFHLIQRLFNIYQVFPNALFLNEKIGTIIRQGYIGRNPFETRICKRVYRRIP